MIILDWGVQTIYLIPSQLRSGRNVCWSIFLVAWCLRLLLRVECLVFVSVNISTSGVHWRSFITFANITMFVCWWLSWWHFTILLSLNESTRWQVTVSSFALVVGSWRRHLRAISYTWWNSEISISITALESWLRCSTIVFLSQFWEVDCVMLYLIFSNCWEISSLNVISSV